MAPKQHVDPVAPAIHPIRPDSDPDPGPRARRSLHSRRSGRCVGTIALALLAACLSGCGLTDTGVDTAEATTTTLPDEITAAVGDDIPTVTDVPKAAITVCVERTKGNEHLMEEARVQVTSLLQRLLRPGGADLPRSQGAPAIRVALRPMTARSFQAEPVVEVTIPERFAYPDEPDDFGDAAAREQYNTDTAKADASRALATQAVTAAIVRLEGSPDTPATDTVELSGCGARASSDFGDPAITVDRALVLFTTGVTKESDVDRRAGMRLTGATVYGALVCDTKKQCERAATAVGTYGGWSGARYIDRQQIPLHDVLAELLRKHQS